VALLVTLVLMVAVGSRNGAFMLRTDPLLGGLVSTGTVLLYLSLPLLAMPFAGHVETMVHLYAQGEARLILFLAAAVGLGTAASALVGLRLTLAVWLTLWRLQRKKGTGVYARAIRDPSVLRTFRRFVVAVWGISTLLVFGALVFVFVALAQSFVGAFFDPRLRLVELSANVLALALGFPPDDPVVHLCTREAWWIYLLPVLAFWAISVVQLWVVQRREARRLRTAAEASADPRQPGLQVTVDALCRTVGLPSVRVVVSSAISLQAAAVRIGLWRPRRYVEVAADVLGVLEDEDAKALLAHELAHHLAGHCRLVLVLRWLRRLTFAGDGFVLLLQDSSRYEDEADRAATHELGVPRKVLARCLRRMRNARAASKLPPPAPSGLSMFATEPDKIDAVLGDGPAALGFGERWRLTGQVFQKVASARGPERTERSGSGLSFDAPFVDMTVTASVTWIATHLVHALVHGLQQREVRERLATIEAQLVEQTRQAERVRKLAAVVEIIRASSISSIPRSVESRSAGVPRTTRRRSSKLWRSSTTASTRAAASSAPKRSGEISRPSGRSSTRSFSRRSSRPPTVASADGPRRCSSSPTSRGFPGRSSSLMTTATPKTSSTTISCVAGSSSPAGWRAAVVRRV